MAEALDELLRQVADGEMSPEDAEPLVALAAAAISSMASSADQGWPPMPPVPPVPPAAPMPPLPPAPPMPSRPSKPSSASPDGRAVRIQVTEAGRMVVNLRVPMSWTGLTSLVPGLSNEQAARVSEALRTGERGRIVDIQDEDGDGVIISTE
jgi:hypothetical protein